MQFSKCRLTLDVVSVFSLVQDFNTFIYERLLSTVDANVARVALSQTYFGWWRRFRPNVAAVSGRRSRPTFEHLEVMYFQFFTATIGTLGWCCSISVHVPTSFCCCGLQPVYTGSRAQI